MMPKQARSGTMGLWSLAVFELSIIGILSSASASQTTDKEDP
jgi:hypothetical protein